jgi:glycine/D-amino acid oxidase-like deaminating enzyme
MAKILVVGAGIFGVTAALELRRRGAEVVLADQGPIPHPLAESTDISKIVRLDYGDDETYTAMMERALAAWRSWSPRALFHETGVLFAATSPMTPGGFEHDSHALLTRRGHRLERLDGPAIARRFPAWSASHFVDGYFNPRGGYAESGRVVAHLARAAADAGVVLASNTPVASLEERGSRVVGIRTQRGDRLLADAVVVAGGAWTPMLVPELEGPLHATGQPVVHFAPAAAGPFEPSRFPVFASDIARTGIYGFPLHAGVVKIASHGPGRRLASAADERAVMPHEIDALRAFASRALPALAPASIVATRLCVYGDSSDEHFWIGPAPSRPGLVVAAGGSGHAFKFAPLLGELIADACEGRVTERFAWRGGGGTGEERARFRGPAGPGKDESNRGPFQPPQ